MKETEQKEQINIMREEKRREEKGRECHLCANRPPYFALKPILLVLKEGVSVPPVLLMLMMMRRKEGE